MTGNGLSFSIQDNESGPPIKNTSGLARPDFSQFWYHHGSAAPNRPSLQARQSLSPCFAISRINCRVWRDSGATKKVASNFRRLASQPQRSSFITTQFVGRAQTKSDLRSRWAASHLSPTASGRTRRPTRRCNLN